MNTTITVPGLIAALVIGVAPSALAQQPDREQAAANFMQADADGDSALTLSEFTTLIDLNAESGIGQAAMIQRMGRYGMAFGRLDGNGDGLITTDEFQAHAQRAQR